MVNAKSPSYLSKKSSMLFMRNEQIIYLVFVNNSKYTPPQYFAFCSILQCFLISINDTSHYFCRTLPSIFTEHFSVFFRRCKILPVLLQRTFQHVFRILFSIFAEHFPAVLYPRNTFSDHLLVFLYEYFPHYF